MSDDTISRKATICAMEGVDWYHINKDGQLVHGANSVDYEPLYKAKDVYTVLNTMPPAQAEERTEEHTETHACDCINRKDAIDAVETIGFDFSDSDLSAVELEEVCEAIGEVRQEWLQRIKRLPSAQPEIVRCKDCEYGEQDEVGRWFCRGFGCQVGDEDGNGFCSDAERKNNV